VRRLFPSLTAPAAEFARYLRTETVGGVVLLAGTAVALLWANSPVSAGYHALRGFTVGPSAAHLDLTLAQWATDGLLAVFFFVAGLELKRELVVGELASARRAVLPVVAALGGMVAPAAVALSVAHGDPAAGRAWAIPVATDIAFALGVLALVGTSMPVGARVFLLGLAVVDDLGAIGLIAVLYTERIEWPALGAAGALCALYWFLQRRRVTTGLLYVPIAVGTWLAVHQAGVHATVAGVALGLLTRVRADPGEAESPVQRLEHRLQPWSAGLCVPVFALFAAGVPVTGGALRSLVTDRIALGVALGLLVGKPIGIFGASFLAVKLTRVTRPDGVTWGDLAAVSLLGGVGFTVSLLLAELSIGGVDPARADTAKAAVLVGSAVAALLAAALLALRGRAHRAAGEPPSG
jgi:NhaA family Na+:H+ antiporter